MNRRAFLPIVTLMTLLLSSGCVYYNTFYNAEKAFSTAEKSRKASGTADMNSYQTAIAKSLKIIDNYPKSKYYDDALYVIGVSYYHTKQYDRAERRFRELLANYPISKYTREVTVYLAQTRLQLGEVDEAMSDFEAIFQSKFEKSYKAQAAMELAAYHATEKRFDQSIGYYRSVRDSLGDLTQQRAAQINIADELFQDFQFGEALGAYLQVLGLKPLKSEEYHALFQAADCAFKQVRVTDGQAYLKRLASNQLFFDSLGAIKLKMAEGQELEGEVTIAQGTYGDIAATETNKGWVAFAYYRLGLIFQFDYDKLEEAKYYYDKATEAARGSGKQNDAFTDALQRSADIGRIPMYQLALSSGKDTAVTQAKLDDAADKLFQLSQLYWYQLDKPDSAISELQYVVDSFSGTKIAPRAMLALSQMIREHLDDSVRADSIARSIPVKYPQSDYMPEILDALGLRGTAADTGYAEIYIRKAENFWADDKNIDSARYWYQYVVDHFPKSAHYDRARFSLIWLTETFQSPGDSSVFMAYKEYADSFPQSVFASSARSKLITKAAADTATGRIEDTTAVAPIQPVDTGAVASADSVIPTNPQDPYYIIYTHGKDTLTQMPNEPISVDEPFEFPEAAYTIEQNRFYMYFQIHLDFSGKVDEYILKTPSGNTELDRRATRAVATSTFNPQNIRTELQGSWFVYKLLIEKPINLR